jgi:AraC-like DNA-binding protein
VNDTVTLALALATLGQIALCVSLLLMRSWQRPVYLPLAAFFTAIGIVCAWPVVSAFMPSLETGYFVITMPAFLLLGPAFWLYVEGLTSEQAWRPNPGHGWHFLPVALGLVAIGLTNSLSEENRHEIFVDGQMVNDLYPGLIIIYIFVLVLGWSVQSGYYVIRILYRLASYRRLLKMYFASTDNSELGWLFWVLIVIGGAWLLSFANVISDNFAGVALAGPRTGAITCLGLVWMLAIWGLRQKPGFEGRYLDPVSDQPPTAAPDQPHVVLAEKYARSALSSEQAGRIAAKIEVAMERDKVYLDPSISLYKLARQVGAPANHISQTLNEHLETSFFDYVNRWRIRAAKPCIASGSETILDVAMMVGFNARSSFYKAFRRETGQTPSEYRQAHS